MRKEFDDAGRETKLIENYVASGTDPDKKRTTAGPMGRGLRSFPILSRQIPEKKMFALGPLPGIFRVNMVESAHERLGSSAREGDDDAFRRLLHRHLRMANRLALRILKDSQRVEETAQKAFVLVASFHTPKHLILSEQRMTPMG